MKALLLLLALALPASAQTFVNYTLTNLPSQYATIEKIINVPTNTMFKVVSLQSNEGSQVYAEYPQSTNIVFVAADHDIYPEQNRSILGPAKIHFQGYGDNSSHDICVLLGEMTPVNVAPDLSGLAVQPAGHVASVAIETSTNLTAWQPAAPGNYPATNTAAFYRLKFDVN